MSPAGRANDRTVKLGPLEKNNLIFLWKISFDHLLFGEVESHNVIPKISDSDIHNIPSMRLSLCL